jgi:hypothetical protein
VTFEASRNNKGHSVTFEDSEDVSDGLEKIVRVKVRCEYSRLRESLDRKLVQ